MSEPLAVLIVEDSESDAEIIVRLLNKADYAVVSERVDTAEGMRAALAKRTWDMVISDYSLPQFDGSAALTVLQATGQDIPFIVVSGTIGEETAVAMMRAGAHDYLMKDHLVRLGPVVARELREAVARRERRRLEENLRLDNQIMANMGDGVFLIRESDGVIVHANHRFEQMFGYAPGEMIGQPVSIVNAPSAQTPEETARAIVATIKRDGIWEGDIHNIKKDGTTFWCHALVTTFMHDRYGRVWVAIHQDITHRKQAEQDLRSSQEMLQSVIDGTSDAVYVKDLQGRYLLCNKALDQFVGKSMAELLGKDDTALFPPDEARQVMAGDCQVLASDSASTYEELVTTRAGPATFLSTKGPVRDAQGRVIGLFGISRDVTERKRMELALRARNEELERFNKASVGRELRMIELKQELNELCVKLGEPPRYVVHSAGGGGGVIE